MGGFKPKMPAYGVQMVFKRKPALLQMQLAHKTYVLLQGHRQTGDVFHSPVVLLNNVVEVF